MNTKNMRRNTSLVISTLATSLLAGATASAQQVVFEDDCSASHANVIVGNRPLLAFDTTQATTGQEGQNEQSCYAFGTSAIANDVWFTWIATSAGNVTIETCGSQGTIGDTKIAAWPRIMESCPSDGTAVACNDDSCGLLSSISWSVTPGEVYVVQIGSFPGAASGTGTLSITQSQAPPLFDRQRLVSFPNGGFNNAPVSLRHNCVMAYQCNSFDQGDRLIEDVVVPPSSGWLVDRIRFYAYDCVLQFPPPPIPQSTITRVSLAIWNDVPHSPGAEIVYGDYDTNVLAATGWSGIYRVPYAGNLTEARFPVMFVDAAVDVVLDAGQTYYLDWGIGSGIGTQAIGEICPNMPAVPANPNEAGNGLIIRRGTPPRPLDPRQGGCQGNANGVGDDLPYTVFGEPAGPIGSPDPSCNTLPNSSGPGASIELLGSDAAESTVFARVTGGVPAQFGYVLSGPNPGLYIVPPGSSGILCIGSPQYRYSSVALRQVFQFDGGGISRALAGGGRSVLPTDGSYAPVPAVLAGESRAFQAWYRDGTTSNFSTSLIVMFQ
ncbi:MAG: hypothetical protein GY711_25440 [bacterium]|nr:hypothetical protein [bacterium]